MIESQQAHEQALRRSGKSLVEYEWNPSTGDALMLYEYAPPVAKPLGVVRRHQPTWFLTPTQRALLFRPRRR